MRNRVTPKLGSFACPPASSPQEWFAEQSNWYATVLHELVHASGAPLCLNRRLGAYWSSEYAFEGQVHADQIAARIVQLGGEPDFSPAGLLIRSHSEYVEDASLIEMIREDLIAERITIDSYREMIGYLGYDDPTTRRMMEGIFAMEHADDLVSLLEELGSDG